MGSSTWTGPTPHHWYIPYSGDRIFNCPPSIINAVIFKKIKPDAANQPPAIFGTIARSNRGRLGSRRRRKGSAAGGCRAGGDGDILVLWRVRFWPWVEGRRFRVGCQLNILSPELQIYCPRNSGTTKCLGWFDPARCYCWEMIVRFSG